MKELNLEIKTPGTHTILTGPAETFTVNIGLDPKNSQVDFFLYSDELFFLTRSDRDLLFKKELDAFLKVGFNCSVIHIS